MSSYDCSFSGTKLCVYSPHSRNRRKDWDIFAQWYNNLTISVERKQDPATAHIILPRLPPLHCFRLFSFEVIFQWPHNTKSLGASSACMMVRQPIPRIHFEELRRYMIPWWADMSRKKIALSLRKPARHIRMVSFRHQV